MIFSRGLLDLATGAGAAATGAGAGCGEGAAKMGDTGTGGVTATTLGGNGGGGGTTRAGGGPVSTPQAMQNRIPSGTEAPHFVQNRAMECSSSFDSRSVKRPIARASPGVE